MDLSEVKKFEEAKVGTIKLSGAIRIGHTMIEENSLSFLYAGSGCALGALWVGMGHTEEDYKALKGREPIRGVILFSLALGIPVELALEINAMHYFGMPRLKIADWLESEGY